MRQCLNRKGISFIKPTSVTGENTTLVITQALYRSEPEVSNKEIKEISKPPRRRIILWSKTSAFLFIKVSILSSVVKPQTNFPLKLSVERRKKGEKTNFCFRLKGGFLSKSLSFFLTVRIGLIKELLLQTLPPEIVFAWWDSTFWRNFMLTAFHIVNTVLPS